VDFIPPPPALCEGCHRGLACRGIAVRWRAVFVIFDAERPHPCCPDWRCQGSHDAADHNAIGKYVVTPPEVE